MSPCIGSFILREMKILKMPAKGNVVDKCKHFLSSTVVAAMWAEIVLGKRSIPLINLPHCSATMPRVWQAVRITTSHSQTLRTIAKYRKKKLVLVVFRTGTRISQLPTGYSIIVPGHGQLVYMQHSSSLPWNSYSAGDHIRALLLHVEVVLSWSWWYTSRMSTQ